MPLPLWSRLHAPYTAFSFIRSVRLADPPNVRLKPDTTSYNYAFNEAMSITKRYFTSPLRSRS
jgi:hypothetical protein